MRPAKKGDTHRLTERQRTLLAWMRHDTIQQVEVRTVARVFRYAQPRAACDRLVRRGLVERVRPGVYRAVVLRERKL